MKIVSGILKGHTLAVPSSKGTRPTAAKARDALMQVMGSQLDGCRFGDLFAGSGAIGLEALSRGALAVSFYELDKGACSALTQNTEMAKISFEKQGLTEPQLKLRVVDVFKSFDSWREHDVVFADPPYEHSLEFSGFLVTSLRKIELEDNRMNTIVCEYDQRDHDKIFKCMSSLSEHWTTKWRRYGRNSFYIIDRKI